MSNNSVAITGASETTELGKIPYSSQLQLHADAALNAIEDAGLNLKDIDGIGTAGHNPVEISHYLGINPVWLDGTSVGGCSFMLLVNHAVAAINAGICSTVLITHAESGRSKNRHIERPLFPSAFQQEFEQPFGVTTPPTMFTIPVLRYMKDFSLTEEKLATVSVVQREWASKNPRATFQELITVDDVLTSKMICYPFRLLMCCLVSDGGGALILTKSERARDLRQRPVYIRGFGESGEAPLISQMTDFTSSRAFRVSGKRAFENANITHKDVDHLMIYDAFAHLPIYGLEDLGFVKKGEAADFIAEGNTSIGGVLPTNTNGGGLSYMHSGMYGMYAIQEGVRQMRGTASAQVRGAKISVVHGVGGMFSAAGTLVLTNEL